MGFRCRSLACFARAFLFLYDRPRRESFSSCPCYCCRGEVIEMSPKLQVFRNFSETHLVLLKCLDPKHRKSGYMIADFRNVNFNGWIVKSYKGLYTFLVPAMRRTKPTQLPEPWTRIEVSRIKGTSLLARSRIKSLGCLLDIQSFVHIGVYCGIDTHV